MGYLDLILITQFIYEQLGHYLFATRWKSMTFMRVLRLMRIVRALRVIKVMKIFTELWLLIESFSAGMGCLFWMALMIFFVVFVFALVVLQGATTYVNGGGLDFQPEIAEQMHERLVRYPFASSRSTKLSRAGRVGRSFMT